jgi:formylglycine-generating enzyme required for sulfatase activity
MKKTSLILLCFLGLAIFPSISNGKELPKVAVWDLEPMSTPAAHARQLTSFVVSEITKIKKYEVYSQENVRTLAGWTAERMQLGCTDTKCLTALGQMDIAKLISGSVGKSGKRYTVSLNLFDTQNPRAENAISKTCESEDELIELIQGSVRELLGEVSETPTARPAPGLYRDSTTGMEFILVKGGCFEMGDAFGDGNADERPGHEVCLKDFYLGKYEVTQGQWKRVMGGNPSHFQVSDDNPVDTVSWNDAQEFIRRLSQMSGKSYRLPTEAEWEYAARSGGKREKWAGTSSEFELRDYAWFSGNSGSKTHPVGQKKPNGPGFYDMSGNVWEWCGDWGDKDYYRNSPKNDPPGPSGGQYKMLRGGSWEHYWVGVRTAVRLKLDASARGITLGFRLGLSPR